jgi:CheY-like chemotaxis protein
VSTVESGSAALALLADQTFDVVLLDLSMPGMSGEETCRRIRTDQRLQSLYVIAYTAHALEHERERILACGFDDILVKPVSRAALLAAVAARP